MRYYSRKRRFPLAETYSFELFRVWPDLNLAAVPRLHQPDSNPPLHQHDFYELVLVDRGSARHYMNSKAIPILPGNLFLIPPGRIHGYLDPQDLHIYNFLFFRDVYELFRDDLSSLPSFQMLFQVQPRLESNLRSRTGLLSLTGEDFEFALNTAEKIVCEIGSRRQGSRTVVLGSFLSFIAHCLRQASLPEKNCAANHYAGQISSLLAQLEQHPDKEWTLAKMAKCAGMSVANFRLCFRMLTGCAPVEYLLQLRLRKAAAMLVSSRLSVGEIAWQTGFQDANYFSRQFRRFYGESPRAYRR